MAEQRMVPVIISHEELMSILDDIRSRVRDGDSLEGSIEWMIPEDAQGYAVHASYRIGNTMGQGGMRVIGSWEEIPAEPQ